MKKFNYTQEEADRLLYMKKWFPESHSFSLPPWSKKHGADEAHLSYPIVGEDDSKFKTTIRTCGEREDTRYYNVTFIDSNNNYPLARMDTGKQSHFNKHTLECIKGPHVHIYDAKTWERTYTIDELLGHHDNTAQYVKAFWNHFRIETDNISIIGDLFDGQIT